jgi:ATP synthase subunit b
MKKSLFFLILPFFAIANEPSGNGYDIVPRVLNFILFSGILYYFIANPIKNAYQARVNAIAARLDSVQQKLKESKAKKDDALRKVQEAQNIANSLIETARKEAAILTDKIKNETKAEIANLEKDFQEQKEFEQRYMFKSVIGEVLNEIFINDSIKIDQNELINIMLKKVG